MNKARGWEKKALSFVAIKSFEAIFEMFFSFFRDVSTY